MKSIFIHLLILIGFLTVLAVCESNEYIRDQFGVRSKNDAIEEDYEYDPNLELDFKWYGMDQETLEEGERVSREMNPEKSVRGSSVLIEKPSIVPFGNKQNQRTRAVSFVFNSLDKNEANWILYPYNFTYIEPKEEEGESSSSESDGSEYKQPNETLHDGAMLSTMNVESFPLHTYMNWIESKTDMDLKKAKAVYDMNIAVLKFEADRQDEEGEWYSVDITYDSDAYCTMFVNNMKPKYTQCFRGVSSYEEWLKSNPTMGDKSVFVFVTLSDILSGKLSTANGENFFGMLIIPDIKLSDLEFVKKELGKAKNQINSFVNKGGVLLTTAKGVFLTETLGYVPEGAFNSEYVLTSPNNRNLYADGCDDYGKTEPSDDTEEEFKRRTLCFSLYRASNNLVQIGLDEAPVLTTSKHTMKELLYFRNPGGKNRLMLRNIANGATKEIDETSYPSVMYKAVGKGHVIANFGKSTFSATYFQFIYNAFLLGASRPIALDNSLVGDFNRTVPALEQVDLGISIKVVNYFTSSIEGAELYVYSIDGTEVKAPSGCSEKPDGYPQAPSGIKVDKVFLCTLSPEKLSVNQYTFSVRIVNVSVTQQKKDIVVLWPHLSYKDPNRNGAPVTVSYGVKIQSAASALLRADMNIDPSSFYPLHAYGTYIDNVMNCENKEETFAYRVQHVSIVPVISPFIDILDQIHLTNALVFDKEYYLKSVNKIGDWSYPFPQTGGDDREADYLDWDLLYDRTNVLAADWDEGVSLSRWARSDFDIPSGRGDFVPRDVIMNADYQTNNDDDTFLLKQTSFHDSDKFYEHAVQRLMAFLDVSTPGGAKTFWNGNVPDSEAAESNKNVGKRRVLFARHDIFWWKKYLMPLGLSDADRFSFISLDKYDKNVPCGGDDKRSFEGVFQNPDGMIPAEYPSKIQLTKDDSTKTCRERIDLSEIEQRSNGRVKVTHYIVPIHENDGKVAGDFYGFNPKTGENLDYPEVKFVKTFSLNLDVSPENSRRGGEIVFKFADSDLPWTNIEDALSKDYVTVSADQIAVYKIYAKSNKELVIRFKRGQMPNEAYGRASHLQIFFEGTNWVKKSATEHTVNMELYEMHYDIAKPEQDFEDWSQKKLSNQQTFKAKGAFSLPALRLQFAINNDIENSFMNPYELREPFVRYGMYEQELISHRAVHGSAEFHPISEPCLVTLNPGFSTFTHVGTSSVPFREYVSTGTSLQIPAAAETGRVEWDDVWGRHFVQNVRSTIFEYPPIPPPLRNFVMTTTFELLDKQGKRLIGGWRSIDEVDVHVQMKLLNNYPKWFEVTACEDNRVLQDCTIPGKTCGRSRVYDVDSDYVAPSEENDDGTKYFKRGQKASYGVCFANGDVTLQGKHLTDTQKEGIKDMLLCRKLIDVGGDHSCEKAHPDLPVLKKHENDEDPSGSAWNYASLVKDYWPEGYIKENMWDLTHYDYDDNQFDKAYKYHMDNNLPHLGHSNTRPDNLISFPLYKGLGYSMVYDPDHYNVALGTEHRGWWSDNLQNKDHTLTAGNDKVNDVSVGQSPLITDWFDISLIQNGDKVVSKAEKNVYTCLFNRRNLKNYVSNKKVTELFNVYENNVVPVPIDFNSKMEFNFDCGRSEWYSPTNISKYPNIVYTDTARDWLYFGANLRGGARENINVLYKLSPLTTSDIKFEGMTKVQDGGRFVYWNPANSKNSYLVVDNPVNVIHSMRSDLLLDYEIIPSYTTTFDSDVYHHLILEDPEEIEREWESSIYTDNYGYGDFTVQIYVGDAGTTAVPNIGKNGYTIRARITFMNNAGFDINMKKNAINSTLISQEAINSDDLMKGIVHALRAPNAYNFLEFEIPEALKKYVEIKPCTSVVGTAPLFFDFDSINVVTIRDGWKGDYYVNINIKPNFPDDLRGHLHEIPVKLVKSYFDQFPGVGDVTGVHNYDVEIPPLKFGVPYSSKSKWAGKVFYTSGYSTDVDIRFHVLKPYTAEDAIIVDEEDIELYRECLAPEANPDQETTEGEFNCLDRIWNAHKTNHSQCGFTVIQENSELQTLSFAPCMQDKTFPVKVNASEGPDKAALHVLLRAHAKQIKKGDQGAMKGSTCYAKDWTTNRIQSNSIGKNYVHVKGAWIELSHTITLLSSSGLPLEDPLISPNNSGLAEVNFTVTNNGDYDAFNLVFNVTLDMDVVVATDTNPEISAGVAIPERCTVVPSGGSTMFGCVGPVLLSPGSKDFYSFRVYYKPDKREGAGAQAKSPLNMRVISTANTATIDLTSAAGERRVTQELPGPIGVKYTDRVDDNMVILSGRRGSSYDLTLSASHKLKDIRVYIWRAKLPKANAWTSFAVTSEPTIKEDVFARFLALGGSKTAEVEVDYVVAVSRTKNKVNSTNWDSISVLTQSNVYEWRVADSNLLLLLLLLPGLLIPAFAATAVFAKTKGKDKEPVHDLGMAQKQKFVPQELIEDEPELVEVDTSMPPPPLPQRAAPAYEPPEPPAETATSGRQYAIPTGPTYLRAGVPVNVIDN